jgi:hypothetical protein
MNYILHYYFIIEYITIPFSINFLKFTRVGTIKHIDNWKILNMYHHCLRRKGIRNWEVIQGNQNCEAFANLGS